MKRTIALLLVFCLLTTMLPAALAEEVVKINTEETASVVLSDNAAVDVDDLDLADGLLDIDLSLPEVGELAQIDLDGEMFVDGVGDDMTSTDNAAKSTVPSKLTLGKKQTYTLDTAEMAKGKTVTYKSSKAAVASVSKKGVITAKSKGKTKIKCMVGKKTLATCTVTVVDAPDSVTLDPGSIELSVNSAYQIVPTLPKGTMASFTYTSKDSKVARVTENGLVTGVKAGTTTVVVKTHNKKTATLSVTVKKAKSSEPKAPGKVTLDIHKSTLSTGDTLQLKATLPKGTASVLTWKSNKPSVAKVNNDGKVTAVGAGTARITVSTANGKTDSCDITVKKAPDKVTITPDKVTLAPGASIQLSATLPKGTTSDLTWKSNKSSVATVNDSGLVTAVKSGTAKITVKTYNGVTDTCEVTVKSGGSTETKAPNKVTLDKSMATLSAGDTLQLTATLPKGTSSVLTWASDNTAVATVKKGLVTAVDAGTANITVKTTNGKKDTCAITVKKLPNKVTLNVSKMTLVPKETFLLIGTLPKGTASDLTWKSNKPAVAKVNEDGLVTAVKAGKAKITVTTANNKTATCTVTVEKPSLESASAVKDSFDLVPKGKATLEVKTECVRNPALSYSWSVNGTEISGAYGSSYTVTAGNVGSYAYKCTVSDGENTKDASFTVKVDNSLKAETASATEQTVFVGGTAVLSASASCAVGQPTYQWYVGDTLIDGATEASYTTGPVNEQTVFTCEVGDEYGSEPVKLAFTVSVKPRVLTEAVAETGSFQLKPTEKATLQVNTKGEGEPNLSYKWFVDGAEIAGANGASYEMTAGNVGSYTYKCTVSDGNNARDVSFTVNVDNSLKAEATSATEQTVFVGWPATLSASGSCAVGQPTYRWYAGDTLIDGATGVSYTTGPVNAQTVFTCEVGDEYGSAPVKLAFTVSVKPRVLTEAVAETASFQLKPTEKATLQVNTKGEGEPNLSYKWFVDGAEIAGANGASYEMTAGNVGSYTYKCTVSDGVNAKDVSFTVNVSNSLSAKAKSATSQTVFTGEAATMEVSASCDKGNVNYQWYRGDAAIGGATGASYAATENTAGSYAYKCVVGDAYGSAAVTVSFTVNVKARTLTSAKAETDSFNLKPTEQATLRVNTTGDGNPTLTYKWTLNGTEISGASGASYTVTAGNVGSYAYKCTVSDGVNAKDVTFTVNVSNGLSASAKSATSQTIFTGEAATLEVSASCDKGNVNYQWYRGDTAIGGAIGASYAATENTAGTYAYKCVVGDAYGSAAVTVSFTVKAKEPNLTSASAQPATFNLKPTEQATLTVLPVCDGEPKLSYKWYLDDTEIDGASAASYEVTAGNVGEYTYKCTVSDNATQKTEKTVTFTVNVDNSFSASADGDTALTIFTGKTATMEVRASAATNDKISYEWYAGEDRNTVIGTESSYTTEAIAAVGSYDYTCVVNDGYGSKAKSVSFTVKAKEPSLTSASAQPATFNLKPTEQATLTVLPVCDGEPKLSYKWYLDDTEIDGASAASYEVTAGNVGEYTYKCTVSDNATQKTEKTVTFTVNVDNSFSASADSDTALTVVIGKTATLAVNADCDVGDPTYQWYEGDTPLDGATGASYTTEAITEGITYKCVVGDAYNSETVTLTFTITAVSLTSAAAKEGRTSFALKPLETATMEVVTECVGTPDLTYAWYAGDSETPIEDADSASYAVTAGNVGSYTYKCVVSDSNADHDKTVEFTVAVNNNLTASADGDTALTVVIGKTATLAVTASCDEGDPTYQWYEGDTPIDGATGASYTTAAITENTTYKCVVGDAYGSETVTLTFTITAVGLTSAAAKEDTASFALKPLETATMEVVTECIGTPDLTYAWYAGDSETPIEDAGSASYTVTAGNVGETAYKCVVSDTETEKEVTFTVAVNNNLTASADGDTALTVVIGKTATLAVTASCDEGDPTYQWYEGDTPIDGATGASYTTAAITENITYKCVVGDAYGSETVTLTFTITAVGLTSAAAKEDTAIFSLKPLETATMEVVAECTGTPKLTYVWYFNDDTDPIANASEASYTVTLSNVDELTYRCVVSDGNTDHDSEVTFTVIVDNGLTAAAEGFAAQSVVIDETATLAVTASCEVGQPTYQWYEGDTLIDGATDASFTTGVISEKESYAYSCVVSDDYGSAPVTVNFTVTGVDAAELSSASAVQAEFTLAPTQTAALEVQTQCAGTPNLTYAWYAGDETEPIANASEASYTVTAGKVGIYAYKCVVSDGNDAHNKEVAFTVTVENNLTASADGDTELSVNACETATLAVTASCTTSDKLSYLWYEGENTAPIEGAEDSSYTTEAIQADTTYKCVVSDGYGSEETVTFTITAILGVQLNATNFPDEAFRGYVKKAFDKDKDDILSPDEIDQATVLWFDEGEGDENLASIQGVEYFTELEELNASACPKLTTMNLSANTKLKRLYLDACALTALDISYNPGLTELLCFGNPGLTTLDISKCPYLIRSAMTTPSIEIDDYENQYLNYNDSLMVDSGLTLIGLPEPSENWPALELDQITTVTITNPTEIAYFSFKPTESGKYTFKSADEGDDSSVVGHLYDEDLKGLESDRTDDEKRGFCIEYELTANTQYYFGAGFNDDSTGTFTVQLSPYQGLISAYASEEQTSFTVAPGSTVTLTVVTECAGEPNLTYAWYAGEATDPIDGATEASYTVTADNVGSYAYRCAVSDGTNTKEVTFTVTVDNSLVAAAVSETAQNVTAGQTATLAVEASCTTGEPTYRWFEGESSEPIEGAESDSYSVTKSEAGTYTFRCEVGDAYGSEAQTVEFTVKVTTPDLTVSVVGSEGSVTLAENGVDFTWEHLSGIFEWRSFKVHSESDFTVSVSSDWMTLYEGNNYNAGDRYTELTIDRNMTGTVRTGTVTFATQSTSCTVTISQEPFMVAELTSPSALVGKVKVSENERLESDVTLPYDSINFTWNTVTGATKYEIGLITPNYLMRDSDGYKPFATYTADSVGNTISAQVTKMMLEPGGTMAHRVFLYIYDQWGNKYRNYYDFNIVDEAITDWYYIYQREGDQITGVYIQGYRGTETEIEIPATINSHPVVAIDEYAFGNNNSITGVTIPTGVTTIWDGAFSGCTALQRIAVPDSIETIRDSAFNNCDALKDIQVTEGTYAWNWFNTHGFFEGEGILESAHPYESDSDETWTYTHPEAAQALKVTFSKKTELEDECDYLYITDANGNKKTYTGSELSDRTIALMGNSFTIRLESDSSVEKYGFKILSVEPANGLIDAWTDNPSIKHKLDSTLSMNVQVSYVGDVTLSYVWHDPDGAVIDGADTSTCIVAEPKSGTYNCVVSDTYGNSKTVDFEVIMDNCLTAQAKNGNSFIMVLPGSNTTLEVEVQGIDLTNLTYQWQKWTETEDDDWSWMDLPGMNDATLPLENIQEQANYICVVQDRYGTSINVDFEVRLIEQSNIADLPLGETTNSEILNASGVIYRIAADNPGFYCFTASNDYGYTMSGVLMDANWNIIATDRQWSTRVSLIRQLDAGNYYFTVCFEGEELTGTITACAEYMSIQTLELGTPATASISKGGQIAYFSYTPEETGYYAFSSSADDEDTYGELYNANMQEIANNDDGGEGSNFRIIQQLTAGEEYFFGARYLNSDKTGSFYVLLERFEGLISADTEESSFTVAPNTEITMQVNAEYTDGESITYRWYQNDEDEPISSVTGPTYALIATLTETYRCEVSDTRGNKKNVDFWVNIENGLTAKASNGESELDLTAHMGTTPELTVTASCTKGELSYQWYEEGDAIDDAKAASYKTKPIHSEETTVRCQVSDDYGNKRNVYFYITCDDYVDNELEVSAVNDEIYVSPTGTATLEVEVSANDMTNMTYRWSYRSKSLNDTGGLDDGEWVSIPAEDDPASYTLSGADAYTTTYRCEVTDRYGDTATAYFNVAVDYGFSANWDWDRRVSKVAPGESATLAVEVSPAGLEDLTYVWYIGEDCFTTDEDIYVTGPIEHRYWVAAVVVDKYWNRIDLGWNDISVDNNLVVASAQGGTTIVVPSGNTAELEVKASCKSGGLSYQWFKGVSVYNEEYEETNWTWQEIQGANKSSYTTDQITEEARYRCAVTDDFGNNEPIEFTVKVIDASNIIPLTLGEATPVPLENAGDMAFFSFAPDADGRYMFGSSDNDGYTIRGTLFDENWNTVVSNIRGGQDNNFRLMHNLEADKTYYFSAWYEYGGTGTFKVRLDSIDVMPLTLNTLSTATISEGGQTVYYSFTPEETGCYAFSSSNSNNSTIGCLYDEAMQEIKTESGWNNFRVVQKLTEGKTYYLGAKFNSESAIGSFNVCVTAYQGLISASAEQDDFTVAPNTEITMQVNAEYTDGESITYRWYQNDEEEPINGATAPTYALTATLTETYRCEVSDTRGNKKNVDFWVNIENGLTAKASNGESELYLTAHMDTTPELTVTASCTTGNPSYQWYEEGNAIDGAKAASYKTKPIHSEETTVRCQVSDDYGNKRNVYFYITCDDYVDNELEVSAVNDEIYVSPTGTATLEVEVSANDMTNMTYRWSYQTRSFNDSGEWDYGDWVSIQAADGQASYTLSGAGAYTTTYRCEVTDRYYNTRTAEFYVTVENDLSIHRVWDDSANNGVAYGGTATLATQLYENEQLLTTIPDGLNYSWYKRVGDSYERIPGETGTSISVGPVTGRVSYICKVVDAHWNEFSTGPMDVCVDNRLSATDANGDSNPIICVIAGQTLELVVTATRGQGGLSYQWYEETDNEYGYGVDSVAIDGATGTTLTTGEITADTRFKCRVTDDFGNTACVTFTIQVLDPSSATELALNTSQEVTIEGYSNQFKLFSYTPETAGWYDFRVTSDDGMSKYVTLMNQNGETIATAKQFGDFKLTQKLTAGTQYYFITGYTPGYGDETYNVVLEEDSAMDNVQALTLGTSATATISEGGQTVYYSFTPEETGCYAFSSSNSNNSTIGCLYDEAMQEIKTESGWNNFRVVQKLTEGKTYYLGAKFNSESAIGSFNVCVTAYQGLISASAEQSSFTVAPNTAVTLQVNAEYTDGESITYQWYKNGEDEPISGEDEPAYTLTATLAREYKCEVSDTHGNTKNVNFQVNIENGLTASAVGETSRTAHMDDTPTLTVTASCTTGEPSYQWYENYADIDGATEASYTTKPIRRENTDVRCRVSDDYGNKTYVYFNIACDNYVRPELTAPQYTLNQASDGVMQEEDLVLTLTNQPEDIDGLSYSARIINADDEACAWADYSSSEGTLTFRELNLEAGEYTLRVTASAWDYDDVEASETITVVPVPAIIESEHPYKEADGQTWSYTHPEAADYLKVTFSIKTDVDAFLKIFDRNGDERRSTGGFARAAFAGRTIILPGNSFTIQLDLDGGYFESYGFKIIRIEAMSQAEYEAYMLENRFTTSTMDDGTVAVTGYNGVETSVQIPGELGGKTVTSIGKYAFAGRSDLTSVTIPNSVTQIGEKAFEYCSGLSGLEIPNGVTRLGEYSLAFCTGITSLTIPDSMETIEPDALRGTGLTSIVIPEKVTNLDDGVFSECHDLASVRLPSNLERIGYCTFQYCSFDSIGIPSSVTEIDHAAFQMCRNLTSVVIPEGVTCLKGQTFQDCESMTSIVIPSSVTEIDDSDFSGVNSNLVIYGEAGSYAQTFANENNFAFSAMS